MRKFEFSYNPKNNIMHIVLSYKKLHYLSEVFSLLNISQIMIIWEYYGQSKTLISKTISAPSVAYLLEIIKETKNNKKVGTLLFLDGYILGFEIDSEIKYLTDGLIGYFITVDYMENDIHVLINTKKYEDIIDKINTLSVAKIYKNIE